MSIASEITRISKNISDSLDAVAAKGVTVPSWSNSDHLSSLIEEIDDAAIIVVDDSSTITVSGSTLIISNNPTA